MISNAAPDKFETVIMLLETVAETAFMKLVFPKSTMPPTISTAIYPDIPTEFREKNRSCPGTAENCISRPPATPVAYTLLEGITLLATEVTSCAITQHLTFVRPPQTSFRRSSRRQKRQTSALPPFQFFPPVCVCVCVCV